MRIFSDVQGQLTHAVGGQIRLKFELVPALMHVIVTCNYEKQRMKNSPTKVETLFFNHNPICYDVNQCLDLAEFQIHPSSHVRYYYLQVGKESDQEQPRTRLDVYETSCPNRCLYIKVAKFRNEVGSAETSYLQNCSVKLFKEHLKVQICKGRLLKNNKITFF